MEHIYDNDIFVPLLPAEREYCEHMGMGRQKVHRDTDKNALRLFSNPSEEHVRGFTGEYVVAKWHPSFKLDERFLRGGDGGADAWIRRLRIDVKARKRLDWPMQVRTTAVLAAIYVLVCVPPDGPGAYIRGWTTQGLVLEQEPRPARNENLAKEGVWNHEVHPLRLDPMPSLLRLLQLEPGRY